MVEKAGCVWAGCVSASSKDGDDLVVGDLAGVWEAVYGVALLTSTRSRSFCLPVEGGAILGDDFLGHLRAGNGHVFLPGKGGPEIEVFEIKDGEGGVFRGHCVEEQLHGLEVSGVG